MFCFYFRVQQPQLFKNLEKSKPYFLPQPDSNPVKASALSQVAWDVMTFRV